MRIREILQPLPLLLLIFLESGLIHSWSGLMTPLQDVSLAAGFLLMLFFALDSSREIRLLSIPAFILGLVVRTPIPLVFVLMAAVYLARRDTSLMRGLFILSPMAVAEGLGLPSGVPITTSLPLGYTLTVPFGLPVVLSLIFFAASITRGFVRDQGATLRPVTAAALYFSAILLLLSFSSLDPLAGAKEGVVACDGYHHMLDAAFFENDTMTHSTLRYLESIGYETRVIDDPFTAASLAGVSVLLIETPEDPLEPSEVDALEEFVKNGGGLFVLGDHTNIMNCYTNLNPILNRFGLHLNFDYSMLWEPHFTSLAGYDSVEETAGATLSLNRSDALIFYALRYTTWADLGDWDAENRAYMGDVIHEEGEACGVLPICASANLGDGRVVAIANSDSLSGANLPYNYAFISRVVEYLDHENSFLRSIWFRIVLLALLAFGLFRARFASVQPLVLSACLVLILVGVQAAWAASQVPEPGDRIALDIGHANIEGYGHPHQYKNVFMVIYAQHYGFNPVIVEDVPEDIEDYSAYVTMGPTGGFSPDEVERLDEYVRGGGTILVFDGYHHEIPSDTSNSAVNTLLERFGMKCNGTLQGEISYFNNTTWGFPLPYRMEATIDVELLNDTLTEGMDGNITMYSAVDVLGGRPIARYEGTPVMAVQPVGLGRVVVVGDHTIFRRFVEYEPVFRYPDENLKVFLENILVSIGGREENGA